VRARAETRSWQTVAWRSDGCVAAGAVLRAAQDAAVGLREAPGRTGVGYWRGYGLLNH